MDVDGAPVAHVPVPPHRRHQLVPGVHPVRVRHQVGQQLELQVREVEGDAVDGGRTPGRVDPDRPGRRRLLGRLRRRLMGEGRAALTVALPVGLPLALAVELPGVLGGGDRTGERRLLVGRHEHQVTDHRRLARQGGQRVLGGGQPGRARRQEVGHVGEPGDLVTVDGAQAVAVGGEGAGGGVGRSGRRGGCGGSGSGGESTGVRHGGSALSREESSRTDLRRARGPKAGVSGFRGPARSTRGNTPGRNHGADGKARTAQGRCDPTRCTGSWPWLH
ncbi:hypothetical protein SCYAM73S_04540 [Streptomyces cyaneofuscatus]